MSSNAPGTIDDYIAGFPAQTQAVLQEVRGLIRETAPEATETISYAIPTFDMNGHHLVHFAGYEHHVGLYPAPIDVDSFAAALAPYQSGKGTAKFPLKDPMPTDLIREIVEWRLGVLASKG